MPFALNPTGRWRDVTLQVRLWKLVAALLLLMILVMWFKVVHQADEILALVRNDVVTAASERTWHGSFVNTNSRTLRDLAVTVELLDAGNRTVSTVKSESRELPFGSRLVLQAPLPAEAVRMRIYSVQWRMDRSGVDRWLRRASGAELMGPFPPWEFGYLMVEAPASNR